MVGPRSSTEGLLSAAASVSSAVLMELAAPFPAACFLVFLSRWPDFPSLALVRSLLLDREQQKGTDESEDLYLDQS